MAASGDILPNTVQSRFSFGLIFHPNLAVGCRISPCDDLSTLQRSRTFRTSTADAPISQRAARARSATALSGIVRALSNGDRPCQGQDPAAAVDPIRQADLALVQHLVQGLFASSTGREESEWPRRPPRTAELIRHLMDQHGRTRADMVPILGRPTCSFHH